MSCTQALEITSSSLFMVYVHEQTSEEIYQEINRALA